MDRANLERLAAALRDLDAQMRVHTQPPQTVEIDAAFLARFELGTWRTSAGDVDVILGIPASDKWALARYDQLLERAITVKVNGHPVRVASLADVIRSKEVTNRPSDQEALVELYALQAAHAPEQARPPLGTGFLAPAREVREPAPRSRRTRDSDPGIDR